MDNSIWSAPSVDWKALPKKILLEESLNDLELTKQYRLHFGKDCKYTYQSTPDLWYCPCGTINHREEAVCHRCKKEAAALSSVDLDLLQEEARERIKQEKEEEEAKKIAHQQRIEAQKAIWKKRMPYAIPLCIVILMVTVIISKCGRMRLYSRERCSTYIKWSKSFFYRIQFDIWLWRVDYLSKFFLRT